MYKQRLSTDELKTHWSIVDTGESINAIPPCNMPPWNDICSELNWELHLLEESSFFGKKAHGYCGVYRLIGLVSEGGLTRPATFNRVCGQDTSGTLYIGQAGELHTRANQIRRGSHQAIRMLNQIPVLDFPANKRAIALLSTIRYSNLVESDLLHAYMNSFGDTPPLNYTI
jgi:hypothetical protein